ncbi:MAG: hypothetical protein Q8P21_01905 [bacterium]|nr:hypothetical protein [bacterium]
MEPRPPKAEETQEISLKLEQYDDIFSDFDMRPYSRRALSVDFLDEIKRASTDKDESGIELLLHVPEEGRSESSEATIKERLWKHFDKHYGLLLTDKRRTIRQGLTMVSLGVIFMVAATFIIFEDPTDSLLLSFLVVFLEPAAWFLLWEGMDQIIFNSKEVNPELSFYRKMSVLPKNVYFKSY